MKHLTQTHVAVLLGGFSAEREVSLASGAAVIAALEELGYIVSTIDVDAALAQTLAALQPDIVFNALHGRWGEDGCVQGLLELMRIPYTHSGVLASALAMDKPMAKKLFTAEGIRCPQGRLIRREDASKGDPLPRPYVVKPANEGSSVGVHLFLKEGNTFLTHDHWNENEVMLAEEYIPGREITVAVLEDPALGARPLGVTELRPVSGFYDYENKYTDGKTEHLCPAPLPLEKAREAMALALAAHRALGCRGLSRADFRYDDTKGGDGIFYLLEVNTQPGMTALSLSPEQAAHAGIEFKELVRVLVEGARLGE